jgi:hypothetical protein
VDTTLNYQPGNDGLKPLTFHVNVRPTSDVIVQFQGQSGDDTVLRGTLWPVEYTGISDSGIKNIVFKMTVSYVDAVFLASARLSEAQFVHSVSYFVLTRARTYLKADTVSFCTEEAR